MVLDLNSLLNIGLILGFLCDWISGKEGKWKHDKNCLDLVIHYLYIIKSHALVILPCSEVFDKTVAMSCN